MSEDDKYDVLEKIGQGSFGVIRKVRRKSDGYVLCRKEISYSKMSAKEKEQLQAELSILKELRHANIVQYIDRVHLKSSHDLHVYMEYCGNGDLGQVIKRLKSKRQLADEEFVWSIFSQLCTALYRCHYGQDPPEAGNAMGLGNDAIPVKEKQRHVMILHRDLKPENVFLGEDNSVKLGDFGLSKILQSHDFASTYVGTPYYMSPEICMSERYTASSDIWALGCIIYELCAQKPPFDAKTHFDLIQRIRRGRFDPLPDVYSPELKKVVDSCLNVDHNRRPETAQLLNLPIVKLMRKEQEVVQMGQLLKKEREATKLAEKELKDKVAALEKEKDEMRVSVDNQLRREWEVKARLEIDRHVNTELERLRKSFDEEVNKRAAEEVERRMHAYKLQQNNAAERSSTPLMDAAQSISTVGEPSDFPSQTDISSLSLEPSPPRQLKPRAATPEKRPARSAFQRAHTTAFNEVAASPMDIQMADPSPISLAGLSLSPRRNAQNAEPKTRRNIFAAAVQRWEPTNMSDPVSPTSPNGVADLEDEMEDDDLPALPSPTRPRSTNGPRKSPDNDPFKVLAANPPNPAAHILTRRNLLARNGPAPNRNPSAPNLLRFGAGPSSRARTTSTVPVVATSPARKRTKVPAAGEGSPTRKNSTGSLDLADAGFTRDTTSTALRSKKGANTAALLRQKAATGNNITANLAGRTLIELAQGKAASDRRSSSGFEGGENNIAPARKSSSTLLPPVAAQWDPDSADAPSPFIKRNAGLRVAVGGLR
ncbi:kinase-like domain-containing protein [Macrophomina phaseolina]|uniref:non-specific serine/threonine protein kinase n=1 Tax=Macrophomina phaseolina TaxID=35725 RepID=A0ABQ8GDJ0_9PEZI|nr:kinase-like domain-containing protein [Macrophomina phaseolina]